MNHIETAPEHGEKDVEELRDFVGKCTRINGEQSFENQKSLNILPCLERVINTIKTENISAELSEKVGELCFNLDLIENAKYFFTRAYSSDPDHSDAMNNFRRLQNGNMNSSSSPKKTDLQDMKTYWNACARDNAMRHIATDNWENEELFNSCGETDLDQILSYMDRGYLETGNYRVLDIGCGIGRILKPFAIRYPNLELYGVDVSDDMISRGKERLKGINNVNLFSNNGKDLRLFDDNFFHIIYSYVVLQHIPRKFVYDYFKEISCKMVTKGLFIFQLPMKSGNTEYDEPPDTNFRTIRHYSEEEVSMLCRSNNLEIVNSIYYKSEEKYSVSAWFIVIKN